MPQSLHFCTYFDRNYLPLGLALLQSLKRHIRGKWQLWVLCLDEETFRALAALGEPSVRCLKLVDLEGWAPDLAAVKNQRSRVAYYWTCTPVLLGELLRRNPEIDVLTYLDADLYFFSDPQPLLDELGAGAALIIEHRYAPQYGEDLARKFGRFNVGLLCFRNDDRGLAVLSWWRERCVALCHEYPVDGEFGDQKYLDEWPRRFANVVVCANPGAGLGPWNLVRYRLRRRHGEITVDGNPLIFYHFHGIRRYRRGVLGTLRERDAYELKTAQSLWLYTAYANALRAGSAKTADLGVHAEIPQTQPWSVVWKGLAFQRHVAAVPWPIMWCLWRLALAREWTKRLVRQTLSGTVRMVGHSGGLHEHR